ncbi:MAG TPA: glycosyltransferase [Bacteroidia bacterium]|nr:glycosyltransferase [Bacteroidia bacterium]HMU19486.1 glycosyltransferase [Bacteroidia bacterium]
MSKSKLIFIYPNTSSFVRRDIAIMQERYQVHTFSFNPAKKIFTPLAFFKQLLFLLYHLPTAKVVVCQIAAYHSFLPVLLARLFRKPSVIFLAGTDCAYFPSLQYGNFCKPMLAWFTASSVRLATHLAPKHSSLIRAPYHYDSSGAPEQGIACFVKNLQTPYTVIPNGFDETVFYPLPVVRKPQSFITVAIGIGTSNINALKGVDLIIEAAALFPACTFTLVGVEGVQGLSNLPANITCLPPQDTGQLQHLYSGHQFYLQLSLSEGFPNAVCEAMLCGCVPIVSDVNALPDIAAGCGIVVKQRNNEVLKVAIEKALQMSTTVMAQKASEHIRKEYTMQKRKDQLCELYYRLIQK